MGFIAYLKKHFYPLLLGLIVAFLCFKNYTPGTFLTGWDNLMPELNLGMNLKRSFVAVWQSYQGLGLVGGMAHATDLIRQLILLPFTLVLPVQYIRYLWHFAMIFLGTFGIYFGLTRVFKFKKHTSFAASFFYLLSFGSVQNFWAPLETFSCFWGFFPWLIFSLLDYLHSPSKTKLKKLLIINFLAIPSFYVQTIFIVYCFSLLVIFIVHPKSFLTLLKIALVNSFWLLPMIYFVITNINSPTTGIGNFMSNDETFLRNFSRGYISDFLLLRGYYFDFPKNNGLLMAPWQIYFQSNFVLLIGYILGLASVAGLVFLTIKKSKTLFDKTIIGLFLLSCIALLSHTPPFQQINQIIRQFPIVDQIFRSPFTKFITPAVFTFAVLLGFFLEKLTPKIQRTAAIAAVVLIVIFSFPSFHGQYISPNMRVDIPKSYFQLFDFFKTQDIHGRIANFPQGSFWGWTNYRWGVTGSGFLWYGIEQPILDRAFDAWNLKNEQYYWELYFAIENQDPSYLSQIIKKYSIQYIIFDKNIYYPEEKIYGKVAINTKDRLDSLSELKQVAQFDQITVYQTTTDTQPYLISQPKSIKPFDFYYYDPAYFKYGHYINQTTNNQIEYPYVNLFTNRLPSHQKFKVKNNEESIAITMDSGKSTIIAKDLSVNSKVNVSVPNSISRLTVYNFPDANLNQDYLVEVNYHYISGLAFEITAVADNTWHKYLNTRLEKSKTDTTNWFIIPAHQYDEFQTGLNIILNSPKINAVNSFNVVNYVHLYPFNLKELVNQEITTNQPPITDNYLVYPQSFSKGWLAFYFQGIKPIFLKNHTTANNWANAWIMPQNIQVSQVHYFFWPQILEWLGFLGLIPVSVWIFKKKR